MRRNTVSYTIKHAVLDKCNWKCVRCNNRIVASNIEKILKKITINTPEKLSRFESSFNGMTTEEIRKFLHGWGET